MARRVYCAEILRFPADFVRQVFLHSEFSSEMASWHGPREQDTDSLEMSADRALCLQPIDSCRPIPELSWEENVIKDPLGRVLTPQLNIYPSEGMPMTADGISLNREPAHAMPGPASLTRVNFQITYSAVFPTAIASTAS